MTIITAKLTGRRTYEVTVKEENREIKKYFSKPLLNTRCVERIANLVEEFNIQDVNVKFEHVWTVLANAAKKAGKKFPNSSVF